LIHDNDAGGRVNPFSSDKVMLNLKKGSNRLVAKVFNKKGGSGFWFAPPNPDIPEMVTLFPMQADWLDADSGGNFDYDNYADKQRTNELEFNLVTKVADWLKSDGESILTEAKRLKDSKCTADDPRWLNLYEKAHILKRTKILSGYLDKMKKVVYTKHDVMGGYYGAEFYSVTELQSNFLPPGAKNFWHPGSQLCILTMEGLEAKEEVLLNDPAGIIRDPDVSFDGKKILFSWKKGPEITSDDYHLYEMDIASGNIRQLTSGKGVTDIEGIYLPNGDIMFVSTRCVIGLPCWYVPVGNIYVMNKDGKYMRRISFDSANVNYPQLTNDGSIIFTRWEYNDRNRVYSHSLFSMFQDGTHQTEFYGNNSLFPVSLLHARPIPDSSKVASIFSGYHMPQRGYLGIVDPNKARNNPAGNIDTEKYGLERIAPREPFLKEPWAKSVIDHYSKQGAQYAYPYPLDEETFIVSYAKEHERLKPSSSFALYLVKANGDRELLVRDPEISVMQPVVVKKRKKPSPRPSMVDYRKKDGLVTMSDVYHGPGLKGIQRGTIKKLRVVEVKYRAYSLKGPFSRGSAVTSAIGYNTVWDVKNILGEVDVMEDGSASFYVPARVPFYLQALDENGDMVQTMRSWATLMPGEKFSCIGCHEDKNSAPPNKNKRPIAMTLPPQRLKPVTTYTNGFSFVKEVQPILDKHCIKCHDDSHAKLQLTKEPLKRMPSNRGGRIFYASYMNLVSGPHTNRKYVKPIDFMSNEMNVLPPYTYGASQSKLIKHLRSGHQKITLSDHEMRTLSRWIDLCCPFAGDYEESLSHDVLRKYKPWVEIRKKMEDMERSNIRDFLESIHGEKVEPFTQSD